MRGGGVVICCAGAGDGERNEFGAGGAQSLAIGDCENIVGLGEQGGRLGICEHGNGTLPCGGKGGSGFELCLEILRKLWGGQEGGKLPKRRNGAGLAAEAELMRTAECIGKRHAAQGKRVRTGERPGQRKLENEIDAALQGCLCTHPFGEACGRAALHEIAAHDGDDVRCAGLAGLCDEMAVAVVKGIEFGNYNRNFKMFHDFL